MPSSSTLSRLLYRSLLIWNYKRPGKAGPKFSGTSLRPLSLYIQSIGTTFSYTLETWGAIGTTFSYTLETWSAIRTVFRDGGDHNATTRLANQSLFFLAVGRKGVRTECNDSDADNY